MLRKSLYTPVDTLIYDLEDSVAPTQKENAQLSLTDFLSIHHLPESLEIAVRVNEVSRSMVWGDVRAAFSTSRVTTLVVPKVHGVSVLNDLSSIIRKLRSDSSFPPIRIIASIESAKAIQNIYNIAGWKDNQAYVSALLFAAEDYCADTSIQRTRSRLELLYARSHVVNAAKAWGIQAIDMVCVDYKDLAYLTEECEDGRRLGFDGKQAIHPNQIETIQKAFAPSKEEISRACAIITQMEAARRLGNGAFGLKMHDDRTEMIDEPMLKQAQKVVERAIRAGLETPGISSPGT
ncbi:hypothetical protein FRB96_007709 [Tulasnella sp. 330]|nr:hypothetical protein FRB96_007709 [Tulasnella sp. 330]KAG8880808.1 hypothetical protein FRB98_004721 [Tulasnella sp. 332]